MDMHPPGELRGAVDMVVGEVVVEVTRPAAAAMVVEAVVEAILVFKEEEGVVALLHQREVREVPVVGGTGLPPTTQANESLEVPPVGGRDVLLLHPAPLVEVEEEVVLIYLCLMSAVSA